jgi:hypothetical protein
MPKRLEVLAFLQETTTKLHKLAREHPSAISPEMLRIGDELAHESAKLESELLKEGLLNAGLGAPKAASQS